MSRGRAPRHRWNHVTGENRASVIGRARERDALAAALEAGRGVVLVEGEAGIGKSRLLAWAAEEAAVEVLAARASEYESDLPYALWLDALGEVPLAGDRHGTHRALRELLEERAPLVVASTMSTGPIPRRSMRWPLSCTGRRRATCCSCSPRARACRRCREVPALRLGPLSEAEARELVGQAADAVYEASGGNPFYLEQLVRSGGAATVAAALAAELGGLDADARRLLDAAALVGDPFDLDLAAEVAELDDPLRAVDELLSRTLIREGGCRGGSRSGIPSCGTRSTRRRGAAGGSARTPAQRRRWSGGAPGWWSGRITSSRRPRGATRRRRRCCARRRSRCRRPRPPPRRGTSRPPCGSCRTRRSRARLADAQMAAGDVAGALATLLDALRGAAPEQRLRLVVAVANAEWWLGRTPDARRRLHVALGELPAEPSPDRIRLRLALALTALMDRDLDDARDQASDAASDARAIGDPVFEAAALAAVATARVSAGEGEDALPPAVAAYERLTPQQLVTRLPGFFMLGRCRRLLGEHEAALADLDRGTALAVETGRENVRVQLAVERVAVLVELGRLARRPPRPSRRSSSPAWSATRRCSCGRAARCRRRGSPPAT